MAVGFLTTYAISVHHKISIKRATTSHLNSLNTKMTTTYDIGNPDPGLEQAQICGVIKPVNVIPTLHI
jgi:hypothetical protein